MKDTSSSRVTGKATVAGLDTTIDGIATETAMPGAFVIAIMTVIGTAIGAEGLLGMPGPPNPGI